MDNEAIKNLVGEAISQGTRGTQSRLARHLDTAPQNVQRWANRMHAPDEEFWPGIEDFFGWESGHIATAGGVKVVRNVIQLAGTDIEIDVPLDFRGQVGETSYLIVKASADDPVFGKLIELAQRAEANEERIARLEETLQRLSADPLSSSAAGTIEGSDAEVLVLRPPPGRRKGAERKGQRAADTGARKPKAGQKRRAEPAAEPEMDA